MKKLIFTIVLLISGSITSAFAQINPAASARLQNILDSVSNKYHIRGVSTAIIVPGVGTWKGVHGTSANGAPLTSDMLFGIGSNTKTYTSCIMLLLQEKGMLSLDDTIGTWIKNQPNISGSITIRQLLNHTSGLYNYTTNPSFNDSLISDFSRVWHPEAILSFVGKPYFAPGKSWSYSNTNYIVAGLIIEKVTGKTYPDVLHNFILDPQHFSNTLVFPYDHSNAIASPWSTLNIPGYPQFDVLDSGYANEAMFSLAWSAGGIMATAEDNAHFWDALISGKIISEESMKQMRHYVPLGLNAGHKWYYGLGIFMMDHAVNNHTVFSHGGTILGYIAENIVDSSTGITISVLTNQDSITNDKIQLYVIRPLHKALLDMNLTAINEGNTGATGIISIYPNPARDYVMLNIHNDEASNSLQLFDMNGKMVMNRERIAAGISRIDLDAFKEGLYICRIISGGQVYTQKVALER